MSVLVTIGAAIAGAFAAAIASQYLRRARPLIIVDEISRSPDISPRPSTALPDFELATACLENGFSAEFLDQREKQITEAEYVRWIRSVLDKAESTLGGLPALHETAMKLNDCLQRNDFDEFEETFSGEIMQVWMSLLVGYRKGEFGFDGLPPAPISDPPTASPAKDGDPGLLVMDGLANLPGVSTEVIPDADVFVFRHPSWKKQIVEDKEGGLFIAQTGPRNLVLPWHWASPSHQPATKALATRIAVAFAAQHVEDLRQVVNFLLKVGQRVHPRLESLCARLKAELRRYERIVIKGNIANRGGSPITMTTTGRLFVGMAGYSFTDEARTLKAHPSDEEIEMFFGAERPEAEPLFESPITVDAGGVRRFVATSGVRIQKLRYADILIGAMTSGERKSYLGAMVVAPERRFLRRSRSRSQFTPTYTDAQPFRDSAAEVKVPPRQAGGLSGLLSGARGRESH